MARFRFPTASQPWVEIIQVFLLSSRIICPSFTSALIKYSQEGFFLCTWVCWVSSFTLSLPSYGVLCTLSFSQLFEIFSINDTPPPSLLTKIFGSFFSQTGQGVLLGILWNMQASKDAWIMTTVSILCAMFTSRENDHHLCFFPAHAHHNFSWPLGDGERVTVARIYFSSLISVNKLHHSNEIWTPTTDSPCLLAWLCFLFCRQQKMTGCKFQHQKRATGFRWQPCLLTGSFEKQGSLGHLRTGRGWWVWKWKKKQRKGWLEFRGACSAMAPSPSAPPFPSGAHLPLIPRRGSRVRL